MPLAELALISVRLAAPEAELVWISPSQNTPELLIELTFVTPLAELALISVRLKLPLAELALTSVRFELPLAELVCISPSRKSPEAFTRLVLETPLALLARISVVFAVMRLVSVVEMFASSLIAAASSLRVSRAAGALSIRLATFMFA